MVEINNQRKAFLDMLAWWRELITDVRKPGSHGYLCHCGRDYLPVTPFTLANRSLNPKLKSTGAGALPASFPLVGCLHQAASLKDFSRRVRTLALQRLRSVALYL